MKMKIIIFVIYISLLAQLSSCTSGTSSAPNSTLTETIISIEDSNDIQTDFEIFYNQFIEDSLFQMNHIEWPLEGNYIDYETEKNWSIENWNLITWDYKNEEITEFDSISFIETDSLTYLSYHCLDCGYSFALKFKKNNDDWKLVLRQENNF